MRCSIRPTATTSSPTIPVLTIGCLLALAACGGTTHTSADAQSPSIDEPLPSVTVPMAPASVDDDGSAEPTIEEAEAPDVDSPPPVVDASVSDAPVSGTPEPVGATASSDAVPAEESSVDADAPFEWEESTPFAPTLQPFESITLPQPEPAPAPRPTFEPVTLDDEDPLPGAGDGGLTLTAATGCADRCIEDATISTAGGSSSRYHLRVDLESPADLEAYLSRAPIERGADGRYVRPSSTPTATGAAGFGWDTSFDLEASTEYHLLVRASDEQGTSEVAGSFTTAEAMGPDELTVPMPCADGCLEWVATEVAFDGTSIDVVVEVDTEASVELAWSTDPFGHDADGNPVLSNASTRTHTVGAGTTLTLKLSGLQPNTAHQVLVTATDPVGGRDRMAGSIATPAPPIVAGIDRMHVHGDGDDGDSDDGEIRWTFGTAEGGETRHWGARGEANVSSNTGVRPAHSNVNFLFADGSGRYSAIVMYAGERDGSSVGTCFVGKDEDAGWWPDRQVVRCRNTYTTWSAAHVPAMTLPEIEQLPTCDGLGVDRPGADRCVRVSTSHRNPQQVSFDMVVWFDLDGHPSTDL